MGRTDRQLAEHICAVLLQQGACSLTVAELWTRLRHRGHQHTTQDIAEAADGLVDDGVLVVATAGTAGATYSPSESLLSAALLLAGGHVGPDAAALEVAASVCRVVLASAPVSALAIGARIRHAADGRLASPSQAEVDDTVRLLADPRLPIVTGRTEYNSTRALRIADALHRSGQIAASGDAEPTTPSTQNSPASVGAQTRRPGRVYYDSTPEQPRAAPAPAPRPRSKWMRALLWIVGAFVLWIGASTVWAFCQDMGRLAG